MKFFRALKKLYEYLTEEEDVVIYEEPSSEKEIPVEEYFIMEKTIENPYVAQVRDWAVNKIDLLHEADRHRNAKALAAEFDEWINIPEDAEKLEYFCLENEDWTDEQEIDVR
jgi:hypothetical protein